MRWLSSSPLAKAQATSMGYPCLPREDASKSRNTVFDRQGIVDQLAHVGTADHRQSYHNPKGYDHPLALCVSGRSGLAGKPSTIWVVWLPSVSEPSKTLQQASA